MPLTWSSMGLWVKLEKGNDSASLRGLDITLGRFLSGIQERVWMSSI